MKADPDDLTVDDVLSLRSQQMLVVNPEYQRGSVWTPAQKKKLIDSVLRGYPIPLIYLHHIRQTAGKLVSERFEVIDGQQRINALSDFHDGAFKLFDPEKDAAEARFPDFIKKQPCPWARRYFHELPDDVKKRFLETQLRVVRIETNDSNEARDLFVRLQSGMPLNSQEKRDAWPGQFTDFILRLGGKPGLARYPGHDFFNVLMGAKRVQDRGKFRQLAAQIAVLYFTRRVKGNDAFCDIKAEAIDDFYYENLGFDSGSADAKRLFDIFDRIVELLKDQKRSKIIGHEAIHLVLFVDTLLDDYTRSWESSFAAAFDNFRYQFALGKTTQDEANPGEYWLRYGVLTRVNSDRADVIQRRHEFFSTKMREIIKPHPKDPQRIYGALERELIYHRDKKRCQVCNNEVAWPDMEIHHVEEHGKGGPTTLDNGALVHKKDCHPKGAKATAEFAKKWASFKPISEPSIAVPAGDDDRSDDDDEDENDVTT
jgi:5-methylcytosine-specific restriction endonuclease McrA